VTRDPLHCDVIVIGGGLVGSVLVDALSDLALDTILVESRDREIATESRLDSRSTALANGSQRILETLGLWESIRYEAEPIRLIHISEQGRLGAARIVAEEEGVAALGYTVENHKLAQTFWGAIEASARSQVLAPARLVAFSADAAGVSAQIDIGGRPRAVRAKLLVAADGMRSGVRALLNIGTLEDDYEHVALTFNCTTEVPPRGRAYERFTPQGPLALLPLSHARVAVVWTLPPERADELLRGGEAHLLAALQTSFGRRLGRIERVGACASFPLSRVRSAANTADRVVLIGNAAVSLHPVAGQGFNLALRDVATLAEVIADALDSPRADVGSAAVLSRYRDWRRRDQRSVAALTHGLIRLFELNLPGAGCLRGAGLAAFNVLPGGKRALARHTMGRAGRLPRLARGLALR
jgi:2-octaprenyl-6-methoxyphenol hydroxylase